MDSRQDKWYERHAMKLYVAGCVFIIGFGGFAAFLQLAAWWRIVFGDL